MHHIETKKLGPLTPDKKIGNGTFRECFTVKEHDDVCIKIVKSDFTFGRRMQAFFMRRRTNIRELNRYAGLPEDIKCFFNPIVEADTRYSVARMPRDHDGGFSRPVFAYGGVSNRTFWEAVEKIYKVLFEKKLWYFDVFNGKNMFVKKESDNVWLPVIVDFKRSGIEGFPLQVHLLLPSEKRKKMDRKYTRFVKKYRKD